MKKPSYLNNPTIANIAAFIAIVISVAGLYFAFMAYELSLTQFTQQRLLVLIGEFGDKENNITVTSLNDNTKFLKGTAFFPSEIHKEPVPIDGEGNFWHLGTIRHELQTHSKKRMPAEAGVVKISDGQLPLLITSYYVTNGEAYTDNSLYMLGVQIQVNGKEYEQPIIRFKNLTFIKRIKKDQIFGQTELDQLFDRMGQGKGAFIPTNVLH